MLLGDRDLLLGIHRDSHLDDSFLMFVACLGQRLFAILPDRVTLRDRQIGVLPRQKWRKKSAPRPLRGRLYSASASIRRTCRGPTPTDLRSLR
jgi:hypothetical protein